MKRDRSLKTIILCMIHSSPYVCHKVFHVNTKASVGMHKKHDGHGCHNYGV